MTIFKSNIYKKIEEVVIDKNVGAGIAKLVEGENLSMHIAMVSNKLKPHYHKERDEIYFIIRGKGIIKINEEEIEVKEGDAILIPKGSIHSIRPINKDIEFIFISAPPFNPEKDRYMID